MFLPTSVQLYPKSRETWRLPSLVPAHRMPGSIGDSAISITVPNSLACRPSCFELMHGTPGVAPQLGRLYGRSSRWRVLMSMFLPIGAVATHESPRLVEMNTRLPPYRIIRGL